MGKLAAQNVGIGTNTPTERLHVVGNLHLDNAFMPGNQAGAVGKNLLSQEAGATPTYAYQMAPRVSPECPEESFG
jgi:hypothetical protein